MNWKSNLKTLNPAPVIFDADMKLYTTYKAGGKAQALALPETQTQLKDILAFAKANNIKLRILGLGSNVLVDDAGIDGIICTLRNMKGITINGARIKAMAGEALDNVIAEAVKAGLGGLEALSGIPGSVGGAVYMNAGAFNAETFNCIETFEAMDAQGNKITLKKADVKAAYRDVRGIEGLIILSATWLLAQDDAAKILGTRTEILAKRAQKQPLEYPSAGSVFKRPEGDYASRLIDVCGLRGLSVGGAKVSEKHAGFIINYNNATATDIKNLMAEVQKRVLAQTGTKLELEQILWGMGQAEK